MSTNLTDGSGRIINTLRISITNKCDLKCFYCGKENPFPYFNKKPLSCDEISNFVRIFATLGINKIKITGGEPLTRPDLLSIIKKIKKIPFLDDISMTTNGVFLKSIGTKLRKAGLKRINISLDTLDRKKYMVITGANRFYDVIEGIEQARDSGFSPIKINIVVMRGINDKELIRFLEWAEERNLILRFIEYMPVHYAATNWQKYFVSKNEILSEIKKVGEPEKIEKIDFSSSGSAEYFRLKNRKNPFGIISAISNPFCFRCNRIRIDSEGNLFLCLYDSRPFPLRYLVQSKSEDKILFSLRKIILNKKGSFNPCWPGGYKTYFPLMYHMGG